MPEETMQDQLEVKNGKVHSKETGKDYEVVKLDRNFDPDSQPEEKDQDVTKQ